MRSLEATQKLIFASAFCVVIFLPVAQDKFANYFCQFLSLCLALQKSAIDIILAQTVSVVRSFLLANLLAKVKL